MTSINFKVFGLTRPSFEPGRQVSTVFVMTAFSPASGHLRIGIWANMIHICICIICIIYNTLTFRERQPVTIKNRGNPRNRGDLSSLVYTPRFPCTGHKTQVTAPFLSLAITEPEDNCRSIIRLGFCYETRLWIRGY